MRDKIRLARLVQAGFFVTGAAMLLTVSLGLGGLVGLLIVGAATMPFAAIIMFGLRCRNCGVSYYFQPSKGGWNVTGVDLMKPVQAHCPKCGFDR